MDPVRAVYRLAVDPAAAGDRALALAREQTVELPVGVEVGPGARRYALGRVTKVEAAPDGGARATIEIPASHVAGDPAQLLVALFGNASLQDDVTLDDVELPAGLVTALGGPRAGIAGIRRRSGVDGRPLTCAALKPSGLSPAEMAGRAAAFARAGIDVVKEDHGLPDGPPAPLAARVAACREALERAGAGGARRALYVASVGGTPAALAERLDVAVREGADAALVAPMVVGLPAFLELVRRSPVPVLAHPAWGGAQRVRPALLLGTLFRLYGADAVVFPHAGGRFPLDVEGCRDLAARLRRSWDGVPPALPVPAGGMTLERIRELVRFYGPDVMLLVGGTLYAGEGELEDRARTFAERVRAATPAGAAS